MNDPQRRDSPLPSGHDARASDTPAFVPTIDIEDIFRNLIEDELRHGRLTRARRKRIVQYAAQLRMSAVQVGQLIEACRRRVVESGEPAEQCHVLPLIEPRPAKVPFAFKISLLIAVVILFDVLLLKWIL